MATIQLLLLLLLQPGPAGTKWRCAVPDTRTPQACEDHQHLPGVGKKWPRAHYPARPRKSVTRVDTP